MSSRPGLSTGGSFHVLDCRWCHIHRRCDKVRMGRQEAAKAAKAEKDQEAKAAKAEKGALMVGQIMAGDRSNSFPN